MNVRVPLLVGAAIALSACVKINDFKGADSGKDGGGSGSDAGTTSAAAIAYLSDTSYHGALPGTYDLQFSDGGFMFPDTLTVGSHQVLGAPPDSCSAEKGVGVAYSPAAMISSLATAETGATVANKVIHIDIPGPGVAKVGIDWSAALTHCTGSISGRSTFSFFPDGRITRMDIARVGSTSLGTTQCSCAGSTDPWEVSTYWSFDTANIDTANVRGFNGSFPMGEGQNQPVSQVVCMPSADHTIGVAWPSFANRARRLGSDVSLFTDLVDPNANPVDVLPAASVYSASTSLYVTTSTAQTCDDVLQYLAPFSQDPQITVSDSNGGVDIGVAQDGIYGGEQVDSNGMIGLAFGGSPPFTITPLNHAQIPPFALWLEMAGTPRVTSVTHDPPIQGDAWYTIQEVSTTQRVFWFPNGLGPDDTIVIQAAP